MRSASFIGLSTLLHHIHRTLQWVGDWLSDSVLTATEEVFKVRVANYNSFVLAPAFFSQQCSALLPPHVLYRALQEGGLRLEAVGSTKHRPSSSPSSNANPTLAAIGEAPQREPGLGNVFGTTPGAHSMRYSSVNFAATAETHPQPPPLPNHHHPSPQQKQTPLHGGHGPFGQNVPQAITI